MLNRLVKGAGVACVPFVAALAILYQQIDARAQVADPPAPRTPRSRAPRTARGEQGKRVAVSATDPAGPLRGATPSGVDDALHSDAIIVLGAAVWPGGRASPALAARMQHAIALYRAGYAAHLILSGGVGGTRRARPR